MLRHEKREECNSIFTALSHLKEKKVENFILNACVDGNNQGSWSNTGLNLAPEEGKDNTAKFCSLPCKISIV